ncbi:sporulation protein [Catellatospora sp. TT07R-123]|uniref:sporulation protein n=1 Tax=Catellatospora sp. TT07R-123 TaxID=2733863 RepID=UPI001B0860F9|nr:sporulation protein [Catellatospora sp. TT07R-123]GHJ43068.1 sporulation protein [Catellatospora sp. TT07R-123]
MVFKKLLASLGLGGVEVDTVLSPHPTTPGGPLTGQVNLRAKSDTDITAIWVLLVATTPFGETELGRQQVAGGMRVAGGSTQSVPFTLAVPMFAPFTSLYGQNLPGGGIGVRTEVAVASGSAKGDWDPVRVDAAPAHQQIIDALGTIGCRFARNELRPGATAGLPAPVAQAVTFYAPLPEGQQPGPHIPQLTFTFTATGDVLVVLTELSARPGSADRHDLPPADVARLSAEGGWVGEVDRWIVAALDKLGQAPAATPGSFMQPHAPAGQHRGHAPGYGQPGYGQPGYGHRPQQGHGYAYGGHGDYRYGGYQGRPSMAGAVAAGVGGAALGFLGGMVIGDMIGDAFSPDVAEAIDDPGAAAADYAGFEDGGFDGGFDGGDFGDF